MTSADAMERFEDRIVTTVLLAAGASGVAIGLAAPRQNATELALGLVVSLFGLWTLRRDRAVV